MDQMLLPLAAGCAAQLWANFHQGRGQGAVQLALLLSFGMPALLALACVHAANLTQSGLAALLHMRMGNVHSPSSRRLIANALPAAALAVLLLLFLPEPARAGLILLCMLSAALLYRRAQLDLSAAHAGSASIRSARCAGPLLALAATGNSLLQVASSASSPRHREGSAAATVFLINLLLASVLCWWLQSIPLLPVLGLLAGAVLAAPLRLQPRRGHSAGTASPVDY